MVRSMFGTIKSSRGRRVRLGWLAVGLAVTVIISFPFYWIIIISVTLLSRILTKQPNLLSNISDLNLDAFSRIIADSHFASWLVNTVIVTIDSAVLAMLVSLMAGYSLSRLRSRGQGVTGYKL